MRRNLNTLIVLLALFETIFGLSLKINSPTTGEIITGILEISATVQDEKGELKKVEFYLDNKKIYESTQPPFFYTVNVSNYSVGTHKLSAVAYGDKNVSRKEITVKIEREWSKVLEYNSLSFYKAFSTTDGGIAIFGTVISETGTRDVYFAKIHKTGRIDFEKVFGNKEDDSITQCIRTHDDGYLLILNNNRILKIDMNANKQWEKTEYKDLRDVILTPEGDYIFAGFEKVKGSGSQLTAYPYVFRMDKNGKVLWKKDFKANELRTFDDVTEQELYLFSFGDTSKLIIYQYTYEYAELVAIDFSNSGKTVKKSFTQSYELNMYFSRFEYIKKISDEYILLQEWYGDGFTRPIEQGKFISIYDKNWKLVWSNKFPYWSSSIPDFVEINNGKRIFINNSAVPTEDGGFLKASGSSVTKFDKFGNLVWSKNFESPTSESIILKVDKEVYYYVSYSDSYDKEGNSNIVVARLVDAKKVSLELESEDYNSQLSKIGASHFVRGKIKATIKFFDNTTGNDIIEAYIGNISIGRFRGPSATFQIDLTEFPNGKYRLSFVKITNGLPRVRTSYETQLEVSSSKMEYLLPLANYSLSQVTDVLIDKNGNFWISVISLNLDVIFISQDLKTFNVTSIESDAITGELHALLSTDGNKVYLSVLKVSGFSVMEQYLGISRYSIDKTNSTNNNGTVQLLINRLESSWSKCFSPGCWDFLEDSQVATLIYPECGILYQLDDGYIIIAYQHGGCCVAKNVSAFKIDKNGNEVWSLNFGGYKHDIINSVTKAANGDIIVVGGSDSFKGFGGFDGWIERIDNLGNSVWGRIFGGQKDEMAYDVITTPDNGALVVGETNSFGNGGKDVYLYMFDRNGNKVWAKTYGGSFDDLGKSVTRTRDGGFLIVGETKSFGRGNNDIYAIKIDSKGNKIWEKTYGGPMNETADKVVALPEGGYVIVGRTDSYGLGEGSIYIIFIDEYGNVKPKPNM